ncbi:hypothetical protein V5F77_06100 [Xanthobacter sp. DSM 24535]|uniref:hypothetical protein n=1 Tax=Roseixanthobacter psychrophilus TaxID=3119917 RepID=UPI0037292E17
MGASRVQLYQPRAQTWNGTRLTGRAALALGKANSTPHYGFAYFSAWAEKGDDSGSVRLSNIRIERVEIPVAPSDNSATQRALARHVSDRVITLPLSLVQASISATAQPPASTGIQNPVPRIVFTDRLTVLVPIDGAPVWQPVEGAPGFQRATNTQAMLLQDIVQAYHLQAGGSWFEASDLNDPWIPTREVPADVLSAAKIANAAQQADPLLPQDGKPISPPPAILVSTVPTELIQTDGPAQG